MPEQPPTRPVRRDRDPTGRPRNARPRDELGRPLPRGADGVVPGEEPEPDPATALDRGLAEFNAGRYFQAHEIWEEGWHPAADAERDFWQGLIQVAVGLTHRQRGNPKGAMTLLHRGATKLRKYGEMHEGIACVRVAEQADQVAHAIEQHGVGAPIEVPHIDRSRA